MIMRRETLHWRRQGRENVTKQGTINERKDEQLKEQYIKETERQSRKEKRTKKEEITTMVGHVNERVNKL
jgi:hypothetical protein